MSIISRLLLTRTSTYFVRNILRSTNFFKQNRLLSLTLPLSNQNDTKPSTLPNQLPLTEKKKAKYNISWKSKSSIAFE